MKRLSGLSVMVVLMLALAACGTSIQVQDNNLIVTVPFSITEAQMNSGDINFSVGNDDNDLFVDVENVDIQDGIMRLTGTIRQDDGSSVDGTMDVQIAAEDGLLIVRVTGVNAEGMSLDDARIAQFNERVASELQRAVTQAQEEGATITFRDVSLGSDRLQMTVEVVAPLNVTPGN